MQGLNGWLLVPLKNQDVLLGFVLLLTPPVKRPLNWEDRDLLKTVGRQAASYLAFIRASDALTDSRQFEAFNRLSAFVVHDLKNLVAQLSLVSSNAKRHLDNPEFVRDAMVTVENATTKMSRMLAQLRKDRMSDTTTQLVSLGPIVRKVVKPFRHGVRTRFVVVPVRTRAADAPTRRGAVRRSIFRHRAR